MTANRCSFHTRRLAVDAHCLQILHQLLTSQLPQPWPDERRLRRHQGQTCEGLDISAHLL
jgi:hypothetical protein